MKYYSRLLALLMAMMMLMTDVVMAGGLSMDDLTFAELESMHAQLADRERTIPADVLGFPQTIEAFTEIIDKSGYTFKWYDENSTSSIATGYELTVESTLEQQVFTCSLIKEGQVTASQIFTIEPAQTKNLSPYINVIYTDYDYSCIQDERPLSDYFQMAYSWMQKWNVTLSDGSNLAANVLKYWYEYELTSEIPFLDPLLCTCYLSDDGQSVTHEDVIKAPQAQHDEDCPWHDEEYVQLSNGLNPIYGSDGVTIEGYILALKDANGVLTVVATTEKLDEKYFYFKDETTGWYVAYLHIDEDGNAWIIPLPSEKDNEETPAT